MNNTFYCTSFSCKYSKLIQMFLWLGRLLHVIRCAICSCMIHIHTFRSKITHFESICNMIWGIRYFCNCTWKHRDFPYLKLGLRFEGSLKLAVDECFDWRRDRSFRLVRKRDCFWEWDFWVQHIECSRCLWHRFNFWPGSMDINFGSSFRSIYSRDRLPLNWIVLHLSFCGYYTDCIDKSDRYSVSWWYWKADGWTSSTTREDVQRCQIFYVRFRCSSRCDNHKFYYTKLALFYKLTSPSSKLGRPRDLGMEILDLRDSTEMND